jgi:hypothetical protein
VTAAHSVDVRFDVTNNFRTHPSGGTAMSSIVTDNIYERPEVLRLSDAAFRMHIRGLAWAATHGTTPELPGYALPTISPLTGGIDLIAELTGAGLWQATEIDDFGYVLNGNLPDTKRVSESHARTSADDPTYGWVEKFDTRLLWRVEGTDSAVGFFPDISVDSSNNQSTGTPFSDRVLDGIPRAHAIVAVAESLLRAHGRDGHHALAIEVSLSTHPYLRAVGERAAEWVGIAFAAGQVTADVPNWRGRGYAELTAFADGGSCYPGWAAQR